MFQKNVGTLDRLIRFLLAIILFYVGFLQNPYIVEESSKMALGILGLLPLVTATFRMCPLYSLVGISTCPAPS